LIAARRNMRCMCDAKMRLMPQADTSSDMSLGLKGGESRAANTRWMPLLPMHLLLASETLPLHEIEKLSAPTPPLYSTTHTGAAF
jgi:hypothetical protein